MKKTQKSHACKSAGFTLTEIIIVITIILVLALLAFTATKRASSSARSAKCVSNLRDLGVAALAYTSENNGCLPPICQLSYGNAWSTEASNRWWPSFLINSNSPSSQLVYTVWRCPEVRENEFQVEFAGLVYSTYVPLRPLVSFVEPTNPTGGMRLASIVRPEKVWMFGDGGRPVGSTGRDGSAERYETVAAMQRFGNAWGSSSRPVCRHNGGTKAHYVACDGHVETITRKEIDDIDNGAFGKFNGTKVEY